MTGMAGGTRTRTDRPPPTRRSAPVPPSHRIMPAGTKTKAAELTTLRSTTEWGRGKVVEQLRRLSIDVGRSEVLAAAVRCRPSEQVRTMTSEHARRTPRTHTHYLRGQLAGQVGTVPVRGREQLPRLQTGQVPPARHGRSSTHRRPAAGPAIPVARPCRLRRHALPASDGADRQHRQPPRHR